MSGLNQHFRDLLVAKGPAIKLIEYTGSLLEKYRQQAAVCEPAFLFGAISLLTEADSKLRTSSSQRLLVELTLMKISTLCQKKKSELIAPIEANYPLPDLSAPRQQVVAPAQNPQPTPAQVSATQPQEPKPASQPVAPQPVASQPAPQPVVAPQPVATPQPAPQPVVTQQTIVPRPSTEPRPTMLGGSIEELLNEVTDRSKGENKTLIAIDAESESKLKAAKDRIMKQMCSERPRFVSAFEVIDFEGNTVKLSVPSDALQKELLDDRFWILKSIAEIAGVNGALDMKIEIKEMDFKLKPIKLEDRVAHIRKVMPEFDYMQKVFDIDVE